MRKLITLIALAAVVVVVGYLALFKRDAMLGLVGQARGLGPAKTPEEALDKFKKAAKARDYETAAKYCGGPFGEQLQRSAAVAGDLGKSLDNLLAAADKRGINLTEKSKNALMLIEVFPADFEVAKLDKPDDAHATATLSCKSAVRAVAVPVKVELKPDGDGKERAWKIHLGKTPWLHGSVDLLLDKGKNYARALEKVTEQIKTKEIGTGHDVEEKLLAELQQASR